jgi:asparagine synthase (glutamine-hydrolysing)
MCGIAGFISLSRRENGLELLKSMTDALEHRGPDGEGHWVDESAQVGLSHRRLSIIDLSVNASQPMHVNDRYVIIFNGEIYNYVELRELLKSKGYRFRSDSDTEVLVCIYDAFREKCLDYLDGMFAFVIYDKKERKIFGARDRFGEKPFFYFRKGDSFFFASEIKALWTVGVEKEIDNEFLFNYLSFGYLSDPKRPERTFYKGIEKLPPSSCFIFDVVNYTFKKSRYWEVDWRMTDNKISEHEAKEKLQSLLLASVRRRLRADVPIGSSLSGGLDSSIIVTLLDVLDKDRQIKRKSFSASFPGFVKDETAYQEIVIKNTSVEPHFVYPDRKSFMKNYERISYHQDEPFGSASINIQYEVFKKAKELKTTVLLDGQGADEIFAGYHGYYYAFFDELRIRSKNQLVAEQQGYKKVHADNSINPKLEISTSKSLKYFVPNSVKDFYRNKFGKMRKAKKIFSSEFLSHGELHVFDVRENFSSLNEALYYSTFSFGLEELLRYADRNSMAHSREVRLPFLDHELVEFVFSLPAGFKIKNGWTKWILRESFNETIDHRIIWRKDKIGYEPPEKSFLDTELGKDLLNSAFRKLNSSNILNRNPSVGSYDERTLWRLSNLSSYL